MTVQSWLRSVAAKGMQGRRGSRTRRKLSAEQLEVRTVFTAMYEVTWLGTLSATDNFSAARGINDLGQVVGDSWVQNANGVPDVSVPFQWDPVGGMQSLGTAGGNAAFSWDINNSGLVSGKMLSGGTMATGGYYEWAALWKNGVGSTIAGHNSVGTMSVAYGSNDNNVVVGNADVQYPYGPAGTSAAYKYDGSSFVFLSGLGGRWSYGMDINNNNFVAGFADTGENPSTDPNVYMSRYHATIWSPSGVIKDLGTLGTDSYAYQINASGQAVGSSIAIDGYSHAFVYDGARMIDIGTPNSNTEALAINDAGQVVGDTVNWLHSSAFLYENGTTYDLNTLVNGLGSDTIMSAHDINNLGQIIGYGLHNGSYRAFVLTPSGQGVPVTPPSNAAPTVDAGGPYSMVAGNGLTLDATRSSDPDGDVLSYAWDVNGDGVFGEVAGATPSLSWTELQTLGIAGGNTYAIGVQVDDGHGHSVVASTTLTVSANQPVQAGPSASASGPSDGYQGVTGQVRTVILEATDTQSTDGYEFRIEWGDGSYDTLNGDSGITADHVYATPGNFIVSLTATDSEGLTSDAATLALNIGRAEQQGDVLAIGGTPADDTLTLAIDSSSGTVVTPFGSFSTSQVMVYGDEGSDKVVVQGSSGNDALAAYADFIDANGVMVQGLSIEKWTADGLAGDDIFYAVGTTLPANLRGGDGNDQFRMAAGSVLDGQIDGGAGSDLLDYRIYQSPATVNLQDQTASAVTAFASVENFAGSNATDTLIGTDKTNTWIATGYDSGTVGSIQFASFENWIGGASGDTFKFANNTGVYGIIDGRAGVNALDYSAYTTAVAVDLSSGSATSVGGRVANIANVSGGAAADRLTGDALDNILFGNAGDDVLNGGSSGNDVLVGGAGNDTLLGSSARSLLIGGLGTDTVSGGAGEDILIGGSTSYDANAVALASLMVEWKRTDLSYLQRIDHLTGKTSGGANGSNRLTTKTVKDDGKADRLSGMDALDWFWGQASELTDLNIGERRN